MAFFGVTLEKIEEIYPHPDADSLELARLRGLSFQFVVLKDKHKEGDKVLYFPLDSIMPQEHLVVMNLSGKLAGSQKNRIKTAKLRGVLSQGLVEFPEKLLSPEFLATNPGTQEITEMLGVTKYEPPEVVTPNGVLKHLPENCSKYDIEGADRYTEVIDFLRQQKSVAITEKMEGTNFSIKKDPDNKIFVNSRSNTIEEEDGKSNMYWEAARKSNLIVEICHMPCADVIVYAELCGPGIQKNIYKLNKLTLFLFDLKIDGKWVPYSKRKELFAKYLPSVKVAPTIYEGPLDDYLKDKTVQEMSDGQSLITPEVDREGLVIEVFDEELIVKNFGRSKIKQRGPIYLCKTGF
jgi:RNA ligase (TIGR02306 family)